MSKFNIDFFELMFLAEVCIPPRPIARASFWNDLCDKHYHSMSNDERQRAFEWLKPKLDMNNADCRYFIARFNPDNQYKVKTKVGDKTETYDCFIFDERYNVSRDCHIAEEYIINIEKIDNPCKL